MIKEYWLEWNESPRIEPDASSGIIGFVPGNDRETAGGAQAGASREKRSTGSGKCQSWMTNGQSREDEAIRYHQWGAFFPGRSGAEGLQEEIRGDSPEQEDSVGTKPCPSPGPRKEKP